MYSAEDHPEGWGFPIRRSGSQRVLASRPSLSQRATSFIASQCQGIHQMPLLRFITIYLTVSRRTQGQNPRDRQDQAPRTLACSAKTHSLSELFQTRTCEDTQFLADNQLQLRVTPHPEPIRSPRPFGSHHIHNVKQPTPKDSHLPRKTGSRQTTFRIHYQFPDQQNVIAKTNISKTPANWWR